METTTTYCLRHLQLRCLALLAGSEPGQIFKPSAEGPRAELRPVRCHRRLTSDRIVDVGARPVGRRVPTYFDPQDLVRNRIEVSTTKPNRVGKLG